MTHPNAAKPATAETVNGPHTVRLTGAIVLTDTPATAPAQSTGHLRFLGSADFEDLELREAWRAVANAKLAEYRRQCWRLAWLARRGAVDKVAAIDGLYEIAIAHALMRSLGNDRIEAIIAEAFAGSDFHPVLSEFAA
jgi:hypothetical protein